MCAYGEDSHRQRSSVGTDLPDLQDRGKLPDVDSLEATNAFGFTLKGFGFSGAADCCRRERRHRFTVCLKGSPERRFSFFRRVATSSSMVKVVRTS